MAKKKPITVLAEAESRADSRAKGGASRWKGTTPEERREKMKELAATRPKLTAEDMETLAWVRENRAVLTIMVDRMKHVQSDNALREASGMTDTELKAAGYELADSTVTHCIHNIPIYQACDACKLSQNAGGLDKTHDKPTGPAVGTCSVCMSDLFDLDLPCPTCITAGRPVDTPDSLHAAQHRATSNTSTAPTLYDKPTTANALNVAKPIPPPEPPPRRYTAEETCRACGRLNELHQNHGGPIAHDFAPQTAP